MTMAATQDRACSTSLMNKGDEALKRLATSAIRCKADLAESMIGAEWWCCLFAEWAVMEWKNFPTSMNRTPAKDVRYRCKSGKHLLVLSFSRFDPSETLVVRRK